MIAIKTENLTKDYGDVLAVNGVNIEVNEGEIFSLLGLNGAGKTTLVKMLSTIVKVSSGDAVIYGNSIKKEPQKVKGLIDISMQETAIARKLTVEENIEFYAKLNGQKREEVQKSKEYVYSTFNLRQFAKKQAQKLSGGWQRKLSIALALVTKPKVLFLDEPTLGLDVIARRELWRVIEQIKKDCTIILTTHYLEEASALSDNIAIMVDGKLKAVDTPKNLIQKTNASNFEDAFIKIAGSEQYE